MKDVSFNKSFFKDVLQGKKKLLKKDEICFYKGKFPGFRELSRQNLWIKTKYTDLASYFPNYSIIRPPPKYYLIEILNTLRHN